MLKHRHLPMPQIVNMCRMFIPPHYSVKFHADADNELIHIIDGKLALFFESGKEFYAERNDTLFIPRGVRHKDVFEAKAGLEVIHINFKWGKADEFFASASPDFMKTLSSKDKNEALLLFDMFRLDQYDLADNLSVAECRLAHLLGIAWRHVFASFNENTGADAYSRLASFARNYMTAHLADDITIDSVAAYLKVSRSTLTRAFRCSSGMSFNERLCSMRMNEAYSMLRESRGNVAECALKCGYHDPAYFSKVFKKHFGFSPKNIK